MSEEKAVPEGRPGLEPGLAERAIDVGQPLLLTREAHDISLGEAATALGEEKVPGLERDSQEPVLAERAIDVGLQLRLAREARGLSLGEAATALKLSPPQVEALETNDWFQWPRTVTRGFVRNYARYLELDAGPFMTELDHVPMPQGHELVMGADSSVNMPREGRRDRRDYVRVVAGLIVLALALLAYFFVPAEMWQSTLDSIKTLVSEREAAPDTAQPNIGQPPEIVPAAPESATVAAIAAIATTAIAPIAIATAPVPDTASTLTPSHGVIAQILPVDSAPAAPVAGIPAAPSSADGTLTFSFAQPAWVEVRDGKGQVIFSQINPAGSQRDIVGQPPFALVIGNASHVALQYKDKPVDLSSRSSREDVARLTLE
jgi:cytoskeleton protein RodZ